MTQSSTLSAVRMDFSQSSLVPKDWKIVERVVPQKGKEVELELLEILKPGEKFVEGQEMMRRARQELNANLGLEDSEIVLRNHHLLPEDYRQYHLVFPGTIVKSPDGQRYVACLRFRDGLWSWYFAWLGGIFREWDRLLRLRK